jgi:hypothetical protein
VRAKRARIAGGEIDIAWLGTWHVAQLRPFEPSAMKKALRGSTRPFALKVAISPAASKAGSSAPVGGLSPP